MKQIQKGLKDFEVYKDSPFLLEGLESKHRLTKVKGEVVSIVSTGELGELRTLPKSETVIVDTLPYTKVYHNSCITSSTFNIPAMKVWFYIIQSLKPNSYSITLDLQSVMDFCGYKTLPNVYRGIVELLEKDFLAKGIGKNVFFINPNFYFNGDRLKNYNKIEE